jgi:hypothetical protein
VNKTVHGPRRARPGRVRALRVPCP